LPILNFFSKEKKNNAIELIIANKELLFQNKKKKKRATELAVIIKNLLSE
jgi:hypothetical protein